MSGAWSIVNGKYRHTPAIPTEQPLAAFVHTTDTHADMAAEIPGMIADLANVANFPAPDFLVDTGDVVAEGTEAEMTAVKNAFDAMQIPWYPTTGGHDVVAEVGDERGHYWYNIFGGDRFNYSFTLGGLLFIFLEGDVFYDGYGDGATNLAWVTALLAANTDKVVFFCHHYAYYVVRDGGEAAGFISNSPTYQALFAAHPKPVIELSGHAHIYGMSQLNGVTFIISGRPLIHHSYRYIKVYADRAEFYSKNIPTTFQIAKVMDSDQWGDSFDSTHTTGIYSYGLPIERNFKLDLTSRTIDFLGGMSIYSNYSGADFTYQATINMTGEDSYGGSLAGLIFRYLNNNNYYDVVLNTIADTISLRKIVNGALTVIDTQSATVDLLTDYTIKVITVGTSIKIYLDDSLLIDETDSAFASGQVGLKSYYATTEFSDIGVS